MSSRTELRLVPSPVDHMMPHVPDDEMIRLHHCYVYRGSMMVFGGPRFECEAFIAEHGHKESPSQTLTAMAAEISTAIVDTQLTKNRKIRTELYCENMRSPLGDSTGEWAVVCRQKNALICSKCEAILCPECAKTGCCCGGDHTMVTMEEFARKLGESEQVVSLIAPLLGGVQ